MGLQKCCVPGCEDKTTLRQHFPNPKSGRFSLWLQAIGDKELMKLQPVEIYRRKVICKNHFSDQQFYGCNRNFRLSDTAIPDRFLTATSMCCNPSQSGVGVSAMEVEPVFFSAGKMSLRKCCVPDCKDTTTPCQTFPNPKRDLGRFSQWLQIIGSTELMEMQPMDVYSRRQVCRTHFSELQHYGANKNFQLLPTAIPDCCLPGTSLPSVSHEITLSEDVCAEADTEEVLEDDEIQVKSENVKEELCRVCGHTNNSLIPIFGDTFMTGNLSLALPEVLEMHLPLELHADGHFPPNICSKCLNAVSEWHELYTTCTAADKAFRNAFGRRKVEESATPCEKSPEEDLRQSVAHRGLEDRDYIRESHEFQSLVDEPVLREHHYLPDRDEEFGSSSDLSVLDTHDLVPEKYEIKEANENFPYKTNEHCIEFVPSNISPKVIFHKEKYQGKHTIRVANNGFLFGKNEQSKEIVSSNISLKEIFQKKNELRKNTCKSNVFKQFEVTECLQLSIPSEESADIGVRPNYIQIDFCEKENESLFEESLETVNSYVDAKKNVLCKYCPESFVNMEQLKDHKKQCQENSTICEICGRKVIIKNLVRHRTRKHCRQVICDKCGKGFNRRQWHAHMKTAHSAAKYCEMCCSVIRSSLAFSAHMKNHASRKYSSTFPFVSVSLDGKSVYMCPVCNKSFDDKVSIIVHLNEPMSIKCPTCRITLKNKKRFILHKCKNWNCQFCMKKFYNRLQWKEHERIHTGERPHKCPECNISFRTMTQKTAHLRNHRAPAYECKYCCKKFRLPGKLVDHMKRIHEGVRYTCNVCNKMFSWNSSMKKHVENHLCEVKHFSCEVCAKKFTREICMKKHLQKHVLKGQL